MSEHALIIDRLGGTAQLAARLGLSEEAVRKWRQRGIPAAQWHRIQELDRRISLKRLAATKPSRRA